jgi:hypothetical protein
MTPSSEQCPGLGRSAATRLDLERDRQDGAYQPKRSTISDRSRQMRPTPRVGLTGLLRYPNGLDTRPCSATAGTRTGDRTAAGRPLATRARRLGPGQVATAGFPAGCSSRAGQAATRAVAVARMLVAPISVQELAVTPGSSRRTPRSRRGRGGQDYSLSGLPGGAARRQPGTTCPVVCPGGRQSTAIRTARGAARWALGANP